MTIFYNQTLISMQQCKEFKKSEAGDGDSECNIRRVRVDHLKTGKYKRQRDVVISKLWAKLEQNK